MKKFFIFLGVAFAIAVVGYLGLNWWTETKHDKPAYEWVQELNDKKKETVTEEIPVEDETTEGTEEDTSQDEPTEEVTVAIEDGEVEATASFNL